MLLINIVDQILSSIGGGVRTDDSKFAEQRIEDKIHVWRQTAIITIYNGARDMAGNKFLGPLNYQQFTVSYNGTIQDAGASYVLFEVPAPIQLNRYVNGYLFLGNKLQGLNFTQVKSPDYFSNAKQAGLIDPNKVYYYRTGPTYIKVWGNTNLRSLFVDGIIANPMLVSDFNPETTDYPASQDVLDLIFKLAAVELGPQSQRPADPVNDMRETIEAKKIDPINA